MPISRPIVDLHNEITVWRRDFHRRPELLYDVQQTAGTVAGLLRGFGCDEVVEGIGRTGIVARIEGRGRAGAAIGLRADMDALPVHEASGKPWTSEIKGRMHACGHDGHMAMLLGAAKHLAATRDFAGEAVLIFQPAEEGGAGGRAMVEDGLMERFGISEVFGMHNLPGLPIGHFAIRSGAMMAASDQFTIIVEGKGGHAAEPHLCIDPIVVAGHIVQALQSIVSRNVDPIRSAVISVASIHAGEAFNVIPQVVEIKGTARTLEPIMRDLVERRMHEMVPSIAAAFGATAKLHYDRNYPVTVNHATQTEKAIRVACDVAGEAAVSDAHAPMMAAEDFAFMLEARPGAFILLGNGDTAGLHHPAYDFADAAIPYGVTYWTRLVETFLPTK